MRMSITTTSGRVRRATASASSPSCGLAHHLHVVLDVEDHAEAGADHRLVVGDQDADGHQAPVAGKRASDREAAAGAGPASSVPP